MAKAIIFDLWGTVVEQGVWSPVKQVRNILRVRLPFPEYVTRMERAMMTTPFSSLTEAFEAVCKEFNVEPTQDIVEKLVGMWNKNWMLASAYEDLAELQKLREKHTLILVTNADSVGVPNVIEKNEFTDVFDHIFLSHDVGVIKSDPSFLQNVLEKIDIPAEDCLFVGDSIQSDMIPAQRAGMKTLLIDRKNRREYEPKIQSLHEVGEHL